MVGLALWLWPRDSPAPPSAPDGDVFSSFDRLHEDLADRVARRITTDPKPDFLPVAVRAAAFPVGTLLRQQVMIPVSAAACQPRTGDPEVMTSSAPTLFPTYRVSRRVAADVGLDEAVFQGAARLGAEIGANSTLALSIGDTQMEQWSDSGMSAALTTDSCRQALGGGSTYRIVRAVVRGKRAFTMERSGRGSAGGSITKVFSLEAEISEDGNSLTLSDPRPEPFVMVLSEVRLPESPTESIALRAPEASSASEGSVFVQFAAPKESAEGRAVSTWLSNVDKDSKWEYTSLPASQMPEAAEVRYFDRADEAKAAQVWQNVKKGYPDAVMVPSKVPAPKGQLEVWLPGTLSAIVPSIRP